MKFDGPVHISDLFGRLHLVKKDKPLSERATLIHYFHSHAKDRKAKPYEVSYIAFRLAHLKLPDLYYLKSICEDAARRGQNWNKTFFGAIKAGGDNSLA